MIFFLNLVNYSEWEKINRKKFACNVARRNKMFRSSVLILLKFVNPINLINFNFLLIILVKFKTKYLSKFTDRLKEQ